MNDPFDKLPDEARDALRRRAPPQWTKPMLAKLTHGRFSDPEWIYERKVDGERCLAFREMGGEVRLMSRNRKRLNETYPELVEALGGQDAETFIADGEIVAFDGAVTSFERLQQRMKLTDTDAARGSGVAVKLYVFDLLYLDRYDVTRVPLRERKGLLRRAFAFDDPVRFMPHRNGDGEAFFEEACRKGWEGLIAKKGDSVYRHSRSTLWLKFKCTNAQEFVIGGYTEPHGERSGFGALLIGYYDDGHLRYAGKVGTGYDEDTLDRLSNRLEGLETGQPPFADEKLPRKGVHWVKPKLVGQFGYTELTRENRLRHPRFLGLRRDKPPKKVHLEKEE